MMEKGITRYFLIGSMLYENFTVLETQRNVNLFIPVFIFVEEMVNLTQQIYFLSLLSPMKIKYILRSP